MNETNSKLLECWGCKTKFPPTDVSMLGPNDAFLRYGVASPECAKIFFELLAFGMEQFGQSTHQLIVDAYAVQHPRHADIQKKLGISPRFIAASIQSPVVHLLGLYAAINNIPSSDVIGKKVLDHILSKGAEFEELMPPDNLGKMMAPDLLKAKNLDEYTTLTWQWAREAWSAWSPHHASIKVWYEKYK